MLSRVGRLLKILMRDLLESNVISIGSSSAPGKPACSFLPVPCSRIALLPQHQSQKLEIGATLLTLPFPRVPNSHGENGTAWSLCSWHVFLRRCGLGKGILRVWLLLWRWPRSSGWDRVLGGRGSCSAKPLLVIVVWGGKLFLGLLHGCGLSLAGGGTESERGPSAGSSLRPYLTFRQLSLSLSKGHG